MIKELLKQVKIENLYEHVLQLEGIRHPVINPNGLHHAGEYIIDELKKYSLETAEHIFTINGFGGNFKNIEAFHTSHRNTGKPGLYISAHYDTIAFSPGANDNATGIAVMLEAARILANYIETGNPVLDVRFIGFTLEERTVTDALHHILNFRLQEYAHGDGHLFFLLKQIKRTIHQTRPTEKACKDALTLLENKKHDLDKSDYESLQKILALYGGIEGSRPSLYFKGLLGSTHFVEESLAQSRDIFGCINLETIGFSNEGNHSQHIPRGLDPKKMRDAGIVKTYRTKQNLSQGNFINIMGDKNSTALGTTFFNQTKQGDIRLPSAHFSLPFTYHEIYQQLPDMLRSDHALFWKHGIPALFITDTANFRYPYYHTEADTIDKLDFGFIEKVCKTVIATVVKTCSKL